MNKHNTAKLLCDNKFKRPVIHIYGITDPDVQEKIIAMISAIKVPKSDLQVQLLFFEKENWVLSRESGRRGYTRREKILRTTNLWLKVLGGSKESGFQDEILHPVEINDL